MRNSPPLNNTNTIIITPYNYPESIEQEGNAIGRSFPYRLQLAGKHRGMQADIGLCRADRIEDGQERESSHNSVHLKVSCLVFAFFSGYNSPGGVRSTLLCTKCTLSCLIYEVHTPSSLRDGTGSEV